MNCNINIFFQKLIGCGLLLSSITFCETALAQKDNSVCSSENRWALIVVTETSPNDVRQSGKSIEESLLTGLIQAGFPQEHIIVLAPEQSEPLAKPTQKNIRAQLQWIKQTESQGRLPNQTSLRQLDEACEVFVYIQMLGIKNNQDQNQYFCPLTDEGKPVSPTNTADLLSASEVSEALVQSTVERRLLVMNILSPIVTRGTSQETLDGIDSQVLLREVPIPTIRAGFGQVIVNGQMSASPGTIDSLADIFLRGLSGYADRSLQGNQDGCVTLRELAEYLEHYGNMASTGSVKTMLQGHDYPIFVTNTTSKTVFNIDTKNMLELVGKNLMDLKTGNAKTPDYESASESFTRAAALAGTNNVVVNVSRNAMIYAEKGSRSGQRIKPSDSLRLLEYENGWFHVESGWIRADTVVSLDVEK